MQHNRDNPSKTGVRRSKWREWMSTVYRYKNERCGPGSEAIFQVDQPSLPSISLAAPLGSVTCDIVWWQAKAVKASHGSSAVVKANNPVRRKPLTSKDILSPSPDTLFTGFVICLQLDEDVTLGPTSSPCEVKLKTYRRKIIKDMQGHKISMRSNKFDNYDCCNPFRNIAVS